jgi:hypothetical protein
MEDDLIAAGHGDEDVSALARWFGPTSQTTLQIPKDQENDCG